MYDTDKLPDTGYSLEDVAETHEADNYVADTEHTAFALASSLYTASEMIGHSNKVLAKAVGVAQQIVGDNTEINLNPFEVSDGALEEGTAYLQMIKDKAKVSLSQSKQIKSEDIKKFKDIHKLISDVGSAEDYSRMVF